MPQVLSGDLKRLDNLAGLSPVRDVDDTRATWDQVFDASWAMIINEERTDSKTRAWRPHFEERNQAILDLGGDAELAQLYERNFPGHTQQVEAILDTHGLDAARRSTSDPRLVEAIEQQREFERLYPDKVRKDADIAAEITESLAGQRKINQSIVARGPGSAAFLGAAGPLVTDPVILGTLPLGLGANVGRSVLMNALRGFRFEAGIAAAIEMPIQANVFAFKREIDSPWTYANAAFNVLAATIGAGAIRAGGSITVDVARKQLAKYGKVARARRTAESDAAAEILTRLVEDVRASPLASIENNLAAVSELADAELPIVMDAHVRALERGRAQAEAGVPVEVREEVAGLEPLSPIDRAASGLTLDNIVTFGPDDVIVDAKRFQFKGGADAAGVTRSLEGVTEFDQSLAGQLLLWEDAAGRQFVVDGHQRLGLAKRALAAGQKPDEVRLSGFVLREADGVSDLDAMRIGAIRNLSAATGTALDAAKVLRGIGPAGEALLPPLPPNSAVLRQGRQIARLGDDAFNAVVNDVIPERQAAIVGELIRGDSEQVAVIQALARLKPANEVQTRSMVEQMRTAGFKKTVTGDLFGERELAESLIKERAQVLDAVLKGLRRDKATFGRLVERGTAIERVGENVLDSKANRQVLEESGQDIEILTRLANQKGGISDALNQAAQEVSEGAKPADVAKSVLDAVRRETTRSDTAGRRVEPLRPEQPTTNVKAEQVDDGRGGSFERVTITDKDGVYIVDRDPNLSPEDAVIEQAYIDKLATTPWLDIKAEYFALEDAADGMILSVDVARELSPDYLADRTRSPAVHEPSSGFIKRLKTERESEPLRPGAVARAIYTAGGTGTGKTTMLRFLNGFNGDLPQHALDGNLAKVPSAIRKIDASLEAGLDVEIMYVDRDLVVALVNGALPRAMRQKAKFNTGRTLSLETHLGTHSGANKAIRELAEHYKDEPRVKVTIIDNSFRKGEQKFITLDELREIDIDEIRPRAYKALDEEFENGKIDQEIYDAFNAEKGRPEVATVSGGRGTAVGLGEGRARGTAEGIAGEGAAADTIRQTGIEPPSPVPARTGAATDLLGDDTRAAQELADETRRRDAARSTGQEEIETGDAGDLFSAARNQQDIFDGPEVKGRGRPDEGGSTGYIPDDDYQAALAKYDLLDAEAGDLVALGRVSVDERGQPVTEVVTARSVMDELDAQEQVIKNIELCTKGTA